MHNREYWDNDGVIKVFTHPLCIEWISRIQKNAAILDFGCGYGRLTPDLRRIGFSDIFGYDTSAPLISRAIRENPGATYTSSPIDFSGKFFDLVLCFALFTSCPSGSEQNGLISLINEVTHDSALLYISDYEIADNIGYHDRYEQCELDIYGCFTSGNAVFRHHEPTHFDKLLPNWGKLDDRKLSSNSLNGNEVIVHQYLYVKGKG